MPVAVVWDPQQTDINIGVKYVYMCEEISRCCSKIIQKVIYCGLLYEEWRQTMKGRDTCGVSSWINPIQVSQVQFPSLNQVHPRYVWHGHGSKCSWIYRYFFYKPKVLIQKLGPRNFWWGVSCPWQSDPSLPSPITYETWWGSTRKEHLSNQKLVIPVSKISWTSKTRVCLYHPNSDLYL